MKFVKRSILFVLALSLSLCLFLALGTQKADAVTNGWVQSDDISPEGYPWYYYENGEKVSGWKVIDGKTYYFDPGEGCKMATGIHSVHNTKYVFNTDGSLSSGWTYINFSLHNRFWCYADAEGKALFGLHRIDGKLYYFDYLGRMSTYNEKIDGVTYIFGPDGAGIDGWLKKGDSWYYGKDGIPYAGWQTINGKTYYFDPTNYDMYTGTRIIDNRLYEFANSGEYIQELEALSGWVYRDGNWYFYDYSYRMVKDCVLHVSGGVFAFDENGIMQTGWYKNCYYLEDGRAANGGMQVDGVWRYFKDGVICRGIFTPNAYVNGQAYCCSTNGIWQKNWIFDQDLNRWTYINDDGTAYNGWIFLDGYWYYFDADGVQVHGWLEYGEHWYYLNGYDYGRMVTRNFSMPSDKKYHLFNEQGIWLGVCHGWYKENGYWYYYIDGICQYNWQKIDGNWYYLDYIMVTGWKQLGGVWYYFAESGAMKTGWLLDHSKWYYFTSSGAMATGVVEIDGKLNTFDTNGKWLGVMKPGWFTDGQYWYYCHENGYLATGWLQLEDTWYFFLSDGSMVTGPALIGSNIYFFNADGSMHTGWYKENGSYYYFDENGAMPFGWLQLKGKWYAFDKYGKMITGWGSDGDHMYYFNDDGSMVTGWKNIDGTAYYFNKNGHCTNY